MPVYDDAMTMLKAIAKDHKPGETITTWDDPLARTVGFKVGRLDSEVHSLRLSSVRKGDGVHPDFAELILTVGGRGKMAMALSHRHWFTGHECGECSVYEVMES